MSKSLSLKLQDAIYEETEQVLHRIHVPRNSYINSAVQFFNKLQRRGILKKELAKESKMVRNNSLEVLEVFEALEDEIVSA